MSEPRRGTSVRHTNGASAGRESLGRGARLRTARRSNPSIKGVTEAGIVYGNLLANQRQQLGLSQKDLAARIRTSTSTIARIEEGHPPSAEIRKRLSDSLFPVPARNPVQLRSRACAEAGAASEFESPARPPGPGRRAPEPGGRASRSGQSPPLGPSVGAPGVLRSLVIAGARIFEATMAHPPPSPPWRCRTRSEPRQRFTTRGWRLRRRPLPRHAGSRGAQAREREAGSSGRAGREEARRQGRHERRIPTRARRSRRPSPLPIAEWRRRQGGAAPATRPRSWGTASGLREADRRARDSAGSYRSPAALL